MLPVRACRDLEVLFPDRDYAFHVGVRSSDARAFFALQDSGGSILAERGRWIRGPDPERYLAFQEAGRAVFDEFREQLRVWRLPQPADMRELAVTLEPDVLFLAPDEDGVLRLRGGALVFPSSWALEDKLGKPVQAIHAPVPGLNAGIGRQIDRLLTRLVPGVAWRRENWGLAAADELNLHPARGLAAPELPLRLDQLWLRVEHQALLAMPRSRGLVFAIRMELQRMDEVIRAGGKVGRGLAQALRTMSPELARYKRIDAVRSELAARLEDGAEK